MKLSSSLLLQNKDTYEPFCKVPLVTSPKEEQRLITTSNKVPLSSVYNQDGRLLQTFPKTEILMAVIHRF